MPTLQRSTLTVPSRDPSMAKGQKGGRASVNPTLPRLLPSCCYSGCQRSLHSMTGLRRGPEKRAFVRPHCNETTRLWARAFVSFLSRKPGLHVHTQRTPNFHGETTQNLGPVAWRGCANRMGGEHGEDPKHTLKKKTDHMGSKRIQL